MEIKLHTKLIEPFAQQFDLAAGIMQDPEQHLTRRASVMRGYYQDEAALDRLIDEDEDPVHYETFESPVPEEVGHLRFCISKLYPGLVGEECFMTKGHYHTVVETGEIYLCLKGRGFDDDEAVRRKMSVATIFAPGRMVYVPPYWAHRSINTGDDPLISLCIYPGDAGHNYGDIATEGFPKRVFRRNGQIVVE
jgi:glucose-6-phosphate isomerase